MPSPISETAAEPTTWPPGSGTTSSSSPEPARGAHRVGRDGLLELVFERRAARTVLATNRFRLPLQALAPVDLDGSGVATLLLLNPTGGVVGGDVLETSVLLQAGSRVCLSTPAATRIYRSTGAPAVQRFSATLGEGAALEYVPDHLIPSPGARLRQRVEVTLAPTSTLIMVDAWAVGRAARGEAWLFHELDSAIVVTDRRGPLLVDRARLAGERPLDGIGGAEGSAYVGTFVAAQPALDAWGDRSQALSDAVARARLDMRFAVMPLGRGGLLARLLCPSAPVLEKAVAALWSFTRRDLLGLDPLCLRKL